MSTLTLESLGLTREEIIDRVVERIADRLLREHAIDEDGDDDALPSPMAKLLERKVAQRVSDAIDAIAGRHVLPNVAAYVETLILQETNKWGEKKGTPMTFVEYLVSRADAYLREEVNYDGKTRGADSYSWKASGTRIAWMVHKHLQHSIQIAMERALKDANSAIVGGLEQAVKIKLAEVLASLKVKAEIGR